MIAEPVRDLKLAVAALLALVEAETRDSDALARLGAVIEARADEIEVLVGMAASALGVDLAKAGIVRLPVMTLADIGREARGPATPAARRGFACIEGGRP